MVNTRYSLLCRLVAAFPVDTRSEAKFWKGTLALAIGVHLWESRAMRVLILRDLDMHSGVDGS